MRKFLIKFNNKKNRPDNVSNKLHTERYDKVWQRLSVPPFGNIYIYIRVYMTIKG